MHKNICVFCSSSAAIAPTFFEVTTELGTLIAQHNHTLVYGGADVGLIRHLYFIAPDAASAISYIETYRPIRLQSKWF